MFRTPFALDLFRKPARHVYPEAGGACAGGLLNRFLLLSASFRRGCEVSVPPFCGSQMRHLEQPKSDFPISGQCQVTLGRCAMPQRVRASGRRLEVVLATQGVFSRAAESAGYVPEPKEKVVKEEATGIQTLV